MFIAGHNYRIGDTVVIIKTHRKEILDPLEKILYSNSRDSNLQMNDTNRGTLNPILKAVHVTNTI
jgi:hypothetical protein